MTRFGKCFLTLFATVGLNGAAADAATVTFTDESAFLAAAGSLSLESFEGEVATNDSASLTSLPLSDFTITTSPGEFLGVFDDPNFVGAHPTDGSQWIGFSSVSNPVQYSFNQAISSFGINIVDFGDFGNGTLEFSNGVSPLFTAAISGLPDANEQFFGIVSDVSFTTVTLTHSILGEFYGIDEVYYLLVPEPSSVVAACLCLAAVYLGRRSC